MSAQACADMAKNMSAKMTKCNDVDVMGKINEALRYVGFDVLVQEYHILYPHWVSISATTKVPASSSKQQTRPTAMHYLSILKFSADMCCISISKLLTFRTYIKAFG